MEKVVLTPETLDQVLTKLDAFMKQPSISQNAFDHTCEVCSPDVVWGKLMNITHLKGVVSIHPLYLATRRRRSTMEPQPLIHVKFNETQATVFYEGNIVYFDGDTVFVDCSNSDISVKYRHNTTSGTRFTRTTVTLQQVRDILELERLNKEASDDYFHGVEEDARREEYVDEDPFEEPEYDDHFYEGD